MSHKPHVLIVGDLMIDEWVYGDVNRISPEAPIPIVDVGIKRKHLGGAGNVYANIKALGGEPYIIGGVSNTVDGHWIENMLDESWLYNIPQTFVKTRICSGQQQIVRLDRGQGRKIDDVEIEEALDSFVDDHIDIVVIADYGKGTITNIVLHDLVHFCQERNIKLLVDPYDRDYYYDEVFMSELIKLNMHEAEHFTGLKAIDENLSDIGRILFDTFDTRSLLITLGPEGMAYFNRGKYRNHPFRIWDDNPVHVYDVCGAGDVVIAVLAYLMCYEPWEDKMEMILRHSITAGRIAVSKRETSVVNYKELLGDANLNG